MAAVVKFREWEFVVDVEATKNQYDLTISGGAESCECNDCKNYVAARQMAFPEEVKTLFSRLGIDLNKDYEMSECGIVEEGLHQYWGWYHFKGEIKEGRKGGYQETVDIGPYFSIGFTSENLAPTHFKDTKGLVQIEVFTKLPWVLDKTLENK